MQSVRTLLVFPLVALMMARLRPSRASSTSSRPASSRRRSPMAQRNRTPIARPCAKRSSGRKFRRSRRSSALISTARPRRSTRCRGADLEKAANAAQQVNEQLVGGASTVVISTTTIIIILLLVIILIIALK